MLSRICILLLTLFMGQPVAFSATSSELVAANKVTSETTTLTKFFPDNNGFLGQTSRQRKPFIRCGKNLYQR